MNINSIRTVSFILTSVLLSAVSCTEVITEEGPQNLQDGVLMTKVINTPSASIEGSLLLCLTDETADALASGDMTFRENLSSEVPVKTITPIFTMTPGKEEVARKHNLHKWYRVEFEGMDNSDAAARLTAFDAVTKVQYNKVVSPASDLKFTPYRPSLSEMSDVAMPFDDPMLSDQWHFINTGSSHVSNASYEGGDIAVKDAWRLTAGDRKVIVAVIDGPVKYDHPDLAANMWKNDGEVPGNGVDDDNNGYVDDIYGWNCFKKNGDVNWDNKAESGHGTHVAGIVAAVNGNGTGVAGVAGGTGNGDGVRLMSCQIFEGGASTLDASAVAFKYAADNGASIAQCSFGYEGEGSAYESDAEYSMVFGAEYDAIAYFMDPANNNSEILDGNIVIAAAGNDGRNMSSYPAAVKNVVSVTALGPDYLPAVNYTNYGPGCNIAAPGGDFYVGNTSDIADNRSRVLSTFVNSVKDANLGTSGHDYVYMQGTSQACPCVSGVAALGLSYAYKLGKKMTRDEFVSMLLTSVNDLDDRLVDNVLKISGYQNGLQQNVDLGLYRGKMGTGAIDAWKFLMAIEGTPTLTVLKGAEGSKAKRYDLTSYFGGSAGNLTYLSAKCDAETREALGLKADPEIKYGKLSINPTKVGSGKVTVTAIAGGENLGGLEQIGGMEITRTISIMSRGVVSDNGGWL